MKKLLFLFILMLSPMLASAQTVSDVQNSGCLNETRGEDSQGEPTIVLTKEGSVLSVQLLNYESNCGTTDFRVTPEISTNEGETCFLTVNVNPVIPGEMDCICPFNVSFTVRDLEPNSFYLDCWWYKGQVKLKEGEPLVLEYNNPDQIESLYGKWQLVGWNDGGTWFEVVDTNHDVYRNMRIVIPKEGYVMAYSMVNEIFVGQLTLNGNEMIFGGEMRSFSTEVYCNIMENQFFEGHICDIKSYQLEGYLLKLYYTDNDYFLFISDSDDSEKTQDDQEEPNDYIPFVKAGKKWNVIRSDFDGGYHHICYRLTNEKVEKAAKTYMKMYRSEDDLTVVYDAGLLREDNRKVYLFDSDMQKEFLLFDYSLKAGDTYETYSYDDHKMVSYKVLSVTNCTEGPEAISYDYDEERDSMITHRRYLRKWTVCRTDDNSRQKTWIESVGSLEGPFANLSDERPISSMDNLAYVENKYLPTSFHNEYSHVHGCNLPTGAEDYEEDDEYHKLTYELEGNRLHVYGKVFTQCGPNNYAYFYESKTDDPLVNKIEFVIQEVAPLADCMALHATNFYVPGFDPNMNYIVVDNYGKEHPVINKTPQMAYRPFVEDGKVWKVGAISGNPVQVVDYYYFDGDTIIDGKTCKQMMCQRYVSPDFSDEYWTPTPSLTKVGAWYEEDKKVYFYEEVLHFMRMKYDFSLEANDTLQIFNDYSYFVLGPKQTGGIKGFKGVYREIMMCVDEGQNIYSTTWLEGVGGLMGPIRDDNDSGDRASFLMSCSVGDEVIYLNDEYEDGATPEAAEARKNRFDFTHTIKTQPKAPSRRSEEISLYGEYSNRQLDINLDPLDDAYLVRITDESGEVVYEKSINAGTIVGLSIDISAYAKGRYTVTVENSRESFTGEFNAQETGIYAITNKKVGIRHYIYNLHGQRLSSLQKGLNIVNGQKLFVK